MVDAVDIPKNLDRYLGDRKPMRRYASFDYCFNYFQSHLEEGRLADLLDGDALQLSCLHLGFYLASWGMLRGRAELLQRSVRAYVPVVQALVSAPPRLWTLDVDNYDETAIAELLAFGKRLHPILHDRASDILVTKVLLGTMGCVPAFDRFFLKGFRCSTFGPKALWRIGQYYSDHAEAIEAGRETTLDFDSGKSTQRRYTQAKVIDMVFFVEGRGDRVDR
jgi:hypothetical protein